MTNMDFESLLPKIVRAFEIEPGNIVLVQFWGENEEKSILDRCCLEIAKCGGIPIPWQYSRRYLKEYICQGAPASLEFPGRYFEVFKPVDIVIDVFTYTGLGPGIPREKAQGFAAYFGKIFESFAQKKFIQVMVPTRLNAEATGLDYETYRTAMMKALNIDYDLIKRNCRALTEHLKGADRIDMTTEGDRKLSFSLRSREWYRDDGTGSVPCGEIYIAPIEESGEGEVLIPEVYLQGEKWTDVVLAFKAGTLVEASEPKVLEHIRKHPGDCDRLAEFGLGLNPGVDRLIGYLWVDEKLGGSAHIAVGFNNYFGGKNESPLHLDFVFRPVRMEIDGKAFIENGELVAEIKALLRS
jgi:aminopeptidase